MSARGVRISQEGTSDGSDGVDILPGSSNFHTVTGERLHDTGNLYGGGSWFVVADTHIWFVRNNGMDGDMWAANNVMTQGAGAIGWRIQFNQAIADELRSLERGELSEFVLPALEPRRQSTLDAFFGDN